MLPGAAPAPIVQPAPAGAPWIPAAVAKLDADLDAMLSTAAALHGAHYGVLAVDAASGEALYDHAGNDEFQPASTLKLVVGSAALDELGPGQHYHTEVRSLGRGRTLVLAGGGDPTLTAADLDSAARAIAANGQRTYDEVIVDGSHFDGVPYPDGWTWDDFGQDYAPIVSALPYQENLVHLHVTPGTIGGPALVTTSDAAKVLAQSAPCDGAHVALPSIESFATTGPSGSTDTIDVAPVLDGCPRLIGSIPAGAAEEEIDVSVEPHLYARAAFVKALHAAGIAVSDDAPPRDYTGPGAVVVWQRDSPPLSELLGPRFWIPSDNLFGELLLKELGSAENHAPGTTQSGIVVEKAWLSSIGVDPATVTLADGCGMSQYDRITPRDLVTILQHDWNGPNRQLVLDSLPVGGARGTIEGIAGTPAAGRVFAKTGSMMHVRGLAGYLAPQQHGAVTFAFNVDDWNGDYSSLAALRAQVLSRIVADGT